MEVFASAIFRYRGNIWTFYSDLTGGLSVQSPRWISALETTVWVGEEYRGLNRTPRSSNRVQPPILPTSSEDIPVPRSESWIVARFYLHAINHLRVWIECKDIYPRPEAAIGHDESRFGLNDLSFRSQGSCEFGDGRIVKKAIIGYRLDQVRIGHIRRNGRFERRGTRFSLIVGTAVFVTQCPSSTPVSWLIGIIFGQDGIGLCDACGTVPIQLRQPQVQSSDRCLPNIASVEGFSDRVEVGR